MISVEITGDRDTCYALRHQVFVQEQNVPIAEERDELDETATHFLALNQGIPVGTARVVFLDEIAKIGRVCVLRQARGLGLGVELIRKAVAVAQAQGSVHTVKLGAQVDAIGFYEKLGFRATGPVYDDAGIDHRDMVMDLR